MPYADNNGVRIYYETEESGKPALILAHGGLGNLNDWRKHGYTDAFRDQFRLVLFDARGHGKSDRPDQASISLMAEDVLAVLDAAGIAKASYWGYSMGSAVGLELAVSHSSRFTSFILGGISPYRWPDAMIKPLQAARDSFLQREGGEADIALLNALINRRALTAEQLEAINLPCLLYCGDKDPYHAGAAEAVTHIPGARFVSVPGVDHAGMKADQVIPKVKDFLAEIP